MVTVHFYSEYYLLFYSISDKILHEIPDGDTNIEIEHWSKDSVQLFCAYSNYSFRLMFKIKTLTKIYRLNHKKIIEQFCCLWSNIRILRCELLSRHMRISIQVQAYPYLNMMQLQNVYAIDQCIHLKCLLNRMFSSNLEPINSFSLHNIVFDRFNIIWPSYSWTLLGIFYSI